MKYIGLFGIKNDFVQGVQPFLKNILKIMCWYKSKKHVNSLHNLHGCQKGHE